VGSGEIDYLIDVAQFVGMERGTGPIFFRTRYPDMVFALGSNFRCQGSGFASTQD
jgi:hypothetical protein